MRLIPVVLLAMAAGYAADVCPGPRDARSWSAKVGPNYCVGNRMPGTGKVKWEAAGILEAEVRDGLEVQVCCFESEKAQPAIVHVGETKTTVATHQEGDDSRGKDDDFPDLIEEDAHAKSVSVRGTLWDGERAVRVDLLLKCSASKFAEQYAFQFTVINRSADFVAVDWDHLRRMRAEVSPQVQGAASVFLTPKRPHEAAATVELKTKAGAVLAQIQFDGYFW